MVEWISLGWSIGTAVVSIIGSLYVSSKIQAERIKMQEDEIKRLAEEFEEFQKAIEGSVIDRLRKIELALVELKTLVAQIEPRMKQHQYINGAQ